MRAMTKDVRFLKRAYRMQRKMYVGMVAVFAVVGVLVFVAFSAKQRRDTVATLVAYGASGKPNSALIADFASCLKQRTFILPLRSIECSNGLTAQYGTDATHRIDVVAKTLTF